MMTLLGIFVAYLFIGVFAGGFVVRGDRIVEYFKDLGLEIKTDTGILMNLYIAIEFTIFWPFILAIAVKLLKDNDISIIEFVHYLRTGEV